MSRRNSEELPKLSGAVRVGAFTFSMQNGDLRDGAGRIVRLRRQTAEVLALLLRCPGHMVAKSELIDTVWSGAAVTDDSLVQCISEIRKALDDRDHQIVRTHSKRGYEISAEQVVPVSDTELSGLPARPSIAVLAFEDFSAGDDRHYLSDAIAEGVIADLSRFPELFVIARNSSFSFRGTPTDVKSISRALGVRFLLEGSQQKSGDRLRVTVQLIDAVQGHHLWSEVFERDLRDLFEVQDEIVRQVVATVAQKVISFEGRTAMKSGKATLTAVLHHLKARLHLHKLSPEGNERARQANLAAIAADPSQPFGYAGLAFVHINGHRWGWTDLSPDEALAEARAAARRAVDLAPDYYDGHAALAYVHLQENDLDQAIARARRGLALNPNDTLGMCDLAEFLGYAGEFDEAEALVNRAMRLDPLYPDWFHWNLAWIHWLQGRNDDALRILKAMSDVPPMAYRVLAIVHIALGQKAEAQAAISRLLVLDRDYSLAHVRRNYRGKFRNSADYDRVIDHLRRAGLPE